MDAQYQIHNTNLEIVEKAKYLGVTIDKRLSWIDHIQSYHSKQQIPTIPPQTRAEEVNVLVLQPMARRHPPE